MKAGGRSGPGIGKVLSNSSKPHFIYFASVIFMERHNLLYLVLWTLSRMGTETYQKPSQIDRLVHMKTYPRGNLCLVKKKFDGDTQHFFVGIATGLDE